MPRPNSSTLSTGAKSPIEGTSANAQSLDLRADNGTVTLAAAIGDATPLGSLVFVQVYRYRYVSTPVQRQQTKWVVFGIIVGLGGFFGAGLLGFILPHVLSTLFTPSSVPSPAFFGIAAITVSYLAMLAIPLSIGFSILRGLVCCPLTREAPYSESRSCWRDFLSVPVTPLAKRRKRQSPPIVWS